MPAPIPEAIIEAQRVRLRTMRSSDGPRIQKLASDPEVSLRTGSVPHPYAEGEAEAWIRQQPDLRARGEVEVYAITLKKDDLLVGALDLRRTEFAHAHEVGFWMGRPYWGRGICSEALIAMVDFAFERDPELLRIFALCFPDNEGSIRVQEKAGLKREAFLRHGLARIEQPRDAYLHAIIREDWADRRRGS